MDNIFYIFVLFMMAISLITGAVTAWDKRCAIKGKRRIPEKVLFLLALLGGSFAEYLTMQLIRHKTQHKSFMIGLPVIMITQLSSVALLLYHLSSY